MNISELSAQKLQFFRLAERMANLSQYGRYHHGSILVNKGGKVLSVGVNKSNFSSFGQRFRSKDKGKATLHAEIDCVIGLDKSLTKGADVYVVRTNPDGSWSQSKCCPMCQSILKFLGVYRAFYSTGVDSWESMKI